MSRHRVGHFMPHHCRQGSFRARHWKNAGINHNFASGQTKGIRLGAPYQVHLPFEIARGVASCSRQPFCHPHNHVALWSALNYIRLRKHLLVALQPQLLLLLG